MVGPGEAAEGGVRVGQVSGVEAGSPADVAGLRPGLRILSVNGCPLADLSYSQLLARIHNRSPLHSPETGRW